jgi:hypothetical protein
MFRNVFQSILFLSLLVCCATAQHARAQPQQTAVSISGAGGWFVPEAGWRTHGFKFIPNADISVSALSCFDFQDDGLDHQFTVGIFDSGGTLLSSTTVPTGQTAPLIGAFRYTNITPLLLSAGQTYTSAARSSGDAYLYAAMYDLGVNSSLTLPNGSGVWNTSPGFNFPTTINAEYQAFVGPNFRFTVVPAPSALAAFVIGAVPGAVMLLRSRRKEAQEMSE